MVRMGKSIRLIWVKLCDLIQVAFAFQTNLIGDHLILKHFKTIKPKLFFFSFFFFYKCGAHWPSG